MSCGRELFNYSQSFLSFGRLQAWIHAIDLWKRILVEVEIDYGSRSPWSAPNCGLFVFQQVGQQPPPPPLVEGIRISLLEVKFSNL